VARHHPRRAKPCRWAERQRHHRHRGGGFDHVAPAWNRGHIGRADLLERLDRAASAGPVDHADQRDLEGVRHRFTLHELTLDRGIGRAAALGEIVG